MALNKFCNYFAKATFRLSFRGLPALPVERLCDVFSEKHVEMWSTSLTMNWEWRMQQFLASLFLFIFLANALILTAHVPLMKGVITAEFTVV